MLTILFMSNWFELLNYSLIAALFVLLAASRLALELLITANEIDPHNFAAFLDPRPLCVGFLERLFECHGQLALMQLLMRLRSRLRLCRFAIEPDLRTGCCRAWPGVVKLKARTMTVILSNPSSLTQRPKTPYQSQ
jgi:hypothetical protein